MLEIGITTLTIQSNTIKQLGDKEAVALQCASPDGDHVQCLIWMTPKSAGIARRQLKVCGFDCDKKDLQDLVDFPDLLKGNTFEAEIEEYNNTLQARVRTDVTPKKKRLAELQEQLRNAKKDNQQMSLDDEKDEDIPF